MRVSKPISNEPTCDGCIWADQCRSASRCSYYDSGNYETVAEEEYKVDLDMRQEEYLSEKFF